MQSNPYQERNVFGSGNSRAQATRRAASYLQNAMSYREREIEEEAAAEAAKYGSDSFGVPGAMRTPPAQSSASRGDWASSAASGLGSLAANVGGLVNQFRGPGAAPSLPSWGSSFQTSLPTALTAAAAAPSAFQPSGSFSAPWTFPSVGG